MNFTTASGKPNGGRIARHPTVIVFVLGVIGAIVGWAVRQEIINNDQQHEIDTIKHELAGRIGPAELGRRMGTIEGRLDTLEKLLPTK